MQMPVKQKIGEVVFDLEKIRLDGGTQPREKMDDATAYEYGAAMREQGIGIFEPVIIYYDGENYWLADGFHRVAGAKQFGIRNLRADIRQGTRRDAVLFSVGANAKHGLRRTNADKRRAVELLLRDDEWRQWSDREIAAKCGVTHPFVGDIRKELTGNDYQSTDVRTGADGRKINTSNIGGKPKAAESDPQSLPGTETAYPVVDCRLLMSYYVGDPLRRSPAWFWNCPFCGEKSQTGDFVATTNNFKCYACKREGDHLQWTDLWLATIKKPLESSYRMRILSTAKNLGRLTPFAFDKWYPVRHPDHVIYNDPFESQKAGSADARYRYPACAIQNGSLIIDGIARGGNYAQYEIADPLPEPAQTDDAPEDDQPNVTVSENLFEGFGATAVYEIPVEHMPILQPPESPILAAMDEREKAFADAVGEPDPVVDAIHQRREILIAIKRKVNVLSAEADRLAEFSGLADNVSVQTQLNLMFSNVVRALDTMIAAWQ